VHGGQQLSMFNTNASGHCFQPIHIFGGNPGKPILSLIPPGYTDPQVKAMEARDYQPC
jgi:hypothetical protein